MAQAIKLADGYTKDAYLKEILLGRLAVGPFMKVAIRCWHHNVPVDEAIKQLDKVTGN